MIHSKGSFILRLAALVALLVGLVGVSLPTPALAEPPATGTIVIKKVTDPAGGTGFQFTHNIVAAPPPAPPTTASTSITGRRRPSLSFLLLIPTPLPKPIHR